MSPYDQRLPGGSVRLLQLLPHQDENSRLECRLVTFPLLDRGISHPYEALSYVWGSEDNKRPIHIGDNDELLITANLYAALRHLRYCFVERILWVDAICINQADDDEKGQQVQVMAKIYAKASRVVVWLGETANNSDQALEAIRMAAENQYKNSTYQLVSPAPPDEKPGISSSDGTNQDADAILALLHREWFRRIWVGGRQSTPW